MRKTRVMRYLINTPGGKNGGTKEQRNRGDT